MKREGYLANRLGIVLLLAVLSLFFGSTAHADRFQSTNFTIDTSTIGGSIAGEQSSTNYKLVSSGGESVIGNGASGSYALGSGYASTLDKSLQLNLQPGGLLAHYTFDQSVSETTYDQSATGLNLAAAGTPTTTTGQIGSAVQIADNDSLQSSTSGASAIDASNITVEAWLKYDNWSTSTNSPAVARWDSSTTNGSWRIGRTGAQQFRFSVYINNQVYTVESNSSKNAGEWYHVVGTYDGTTLRIYVNGVQEDSSNISQGSLPSSGAPLSIGEYANQDNPYWAGSVDEVKIFNRVLSAREVAAEHSAQASGIPSGLSLGAVTAGTSNTATADTIVQTDAPGYSLAISQDHDMQTASSTVPLDFHETFNSLTPGADVTAGVTNFSGRFSTGSATFTATNAGIDGVFTRINTTTSSSGSYRYVFPGASSTLYYLRMYVRINAIPSSNVTIMNLLEPSDTTLGNIQLLSDGTLRMRNINTAVDVSSSVVPLDTWVRLEWRYNSSSGSQTLRYYEGANVNGSTPTETLSGAAQTGKDIGILAVGLTQSVPSIAFDLDEVAGSTVDYPDPLGTYVTIPGVAGDITTPLSWSEGTTKGLGFTLYGTNATALPGKWSSGSAYASLPGTATTYYTRTGYTGGVKDVHNMRLRLDTATTQYPGDYSNTMTVTGTMTP